MFIIVNKKSFYFIGKVKELRKNLNELNTEYTTVAQFIKSKLH
ncbi:hypothetical protein [Desulfitibacter alkalitolerans]|nr:hypothetical protein [Desulfitibacter alkalitolerans]